MGNASLVTQIPINGRSEVGTGAPISAVKIFQASMADGYNNAVAAGFADDGTTAIPTPGSSYDGTYTNLTSRNPIVNKIGSGSLYQITVPYETVSVTIGGERAQNPLDRDPVYHEYGQPTTIETDRDSAGNIIVNSAGQVLKAVVQHADLYVQAIVNDDDNNDWTAYFERTNSASYTLNGKSYAAHAVFLSHVDKVWTEEEFDGATLQYYQYTFHFYIRFPRSTNDPSDWRFKILNQGTVEKDGTNQVAIKDDNDNIITEPRNLDNAGAVIAPGGTPYWLASASTYSTSATSRVQMYQTTSFASLPV